MKRKLLLYLFLVLISTLSILQIYVSHKLSFSSVELKKMQEEIETLNIENELLKSEIATASSLMNVAKKAENLGFKRATFLYMENLPVTLGK